MITLHLIKICQVVQENSPTNTCANKNVALISAAGDPPRKPHINIIRLLFEEINLGMHILSATFYFIFIIYGIALCCI